MHNLRFPLIVAAALSAAIGGDAFADDAQCSARFTFQWGQQSAGTLATRAGTACRIPLLMSGNSTVTSARVVQAPRNGSAAAVGAGIIRFQPRAGFTGQDSMAVRYGGTGAAGKPRDATVTFAITVY